MSQIAVVAIGGNSLIKDSQHQTVQDQYQLIAETVSHLIPILDAGYKLAVTHGNGPQVGFILLRSFLSRHALHEVPLESCVADTQGSIGYQLQLAFHNEFLRRAINKKAVTVVTQVCVDSGDPGFTNPTKPIGSFYSKEEAEQLQKTNNWAMVEDCGRGYRRVVASPEPIEIVELSAIENLLNTDHVVVTVGGGGIPVIKQADGSLIGVGAVIDKDRASCLLANNLRAELFLISTAVEHACLNFGKPDQKVITHMTVAEARKAVKEGHFHKGSMLPKIEAAIKFIDNGGKKVIITKPESIGRALKGESGTHITA